MRRAVVNSTLRRAPLSIVVARITTHSPQTCCQARPFSGSNLGFATFSNAVAALPTLEREVQGDDHVAQVAPEGTSKEAMVLNTKKLCAKVGQSFRFSKAEEITIYETRERKKIREALSSRVRNSRDNDPAKVVLTGMGGMGKSHNLAYWVQQQREEGHLVVYVNDMEDWIEWGDMYIFSEIVFGLCNWAYWGGAVDLNKVSTLSAAHAWLRNPDGVKLQSDLEKWADKRMKDLSGYTVFSDDPRADMALLRRVVDAANAYEESSGAGETHKRRRLLLVVDQDNRLQKMWSGSDRPRHDANPQAFHIDRMIVENWAHLRVASASANNEGWVRRGWGDTLVQLAHGLEPEDADAMIRRLLAPHNLYSKTVSGRIQEGTGNCPLDIQLVCEAASIGATSASLVAVEVGICEAKRMWSELRGRDSLEAEIRMLWNRPSEPSQDAIQQLRARMEKSPTPGQLPSIDRSANEALDVALVAELVRFVVLDRAFKSWSTHIGIAFQAYASSLQGKDQEALAVSVLTETPSHVMDRRFMEFDSHFTYRNPHIAVTIKAWARGNAPIQNLGDGAHAYEQTCICALPYLLTARNWLPPPILCLQTVFPHQDVLARHQEFTI